MTFKNYVENVYLKLFIEFIKGRWSSGYDAKVLKLRNAYNVEVGGSNPPRPISSFLITKKIKNTATNKIKNHR